eukprot:CAMPEP_0116136078 /NCGR_PEP_ID=MMETSP0329-20121206/11528_1 /TAXON_ID=697910 /ORGANISM="Pseudo-nitzschia arenysensis, Strain B593" /LENGTH=550 /DNA_ID=CAMNT_0003630913 /DNA_START=142 /DNA_END=1794 /DNA_ORIENTATION=+
MRVKGVPRGDGGDESSSDDSSLIRPKSRPSFAGRNSGADNLNSSRRASLFMRSNNEVLAMSQRERVKLQFKKFFSMRSATEGDTRNDVEENNPPQYRLEAPRRKRTGLFCCKGAVGTRGLSDIKPNEQLASWLHWTFRSNFLILIFVMSCLFFTFIYIFAGIIFGAGRMNSECVRVGGETPASFSDSFALSWTTFSTVGYGSTYPALSHENESKTHCFFVTLICSLESFIGVLYSGFCGAILFGKVLRMQSHAQVIFSDAIVIRYGSGIQEQFDESENDLNEERVRDKIPCPVLEFRIVNRLFDEPGGEIMDASLNVVANVNARDADPILVDALNKSRRSKLLRRYSYRSEDYYTGHQPPSTTDSIMSDTMSDGSGRASFDSSRPSKRSSLLNTFITRNHHTVDEDPSSRLVNKRIFSKMYFEQCEHPFFKRVWVGRHVLNLESPLVRPKVKRLIRRNNGYWPKSLNNFAGVRQSLLFNQILVSLNGVTNLSAHEVYAQKIYDFVDVNIGYQFVNTLYKDIDGMLKVDTDLINDVREQNGGGGEPLILEN